MDEEGIKGLEEERRLAYVGITRAEELCTISFAGNRRVYGQWQSQMPSRFIDELPEAHVEILTPPGLYGHQSHGMGQSASPVSQMQIASNLPDRAAQADAYNSPGWRRLQARQGEYGLSQPRESKRAGFDEAATVPFDLGERVFHQKFGYGAITAIEGDKLDVAFDKAGVKKVVARFVVAADSAGDQPF
jgi:DNA helicase-2/ATP-dependent DNA helicase PcrA